MAFLLMPCQQDSNTIPRDATAQVFFINNTQPVAKKRFKSFCFIVYVS
jgi:hypothetical protein